MILDTSALAAILLGEPEATHYATLIHDSQRCLISAANFVELALVIEGQIGGNAARQCDVFFRASGIIIEPVTVEQAHLARQAFLDFGKGHHPARLNFGDCFAYALAKVTGEPLLFKGQDFKENRYRGRSVKRAVRDSSTLSSLPHVATASDSVLMKTCTSS